MWAKKAKEEHDAFAEALREKGVRVHYFAELLAQVLEPPTVANSCSTACAPPRSSGRRSSIHSAGFSRISTARPRHVSRRRGAQGRRSPDGRQAQPQMGDPRDDDFLLAPLPNHLFQSDNSCWIYGGVSINPMAKPARERESLHCRAIYRFHPMFADADSSPTTATTT